MKKFRSFRSIIAGIIAVVVLMSSPMVIAAEKSRGVPTQTPAGGTPKLQTGGTPSAKPGTGIPAVPSQPMSPTAPPAILTPGEVMLKVSNYKTEYKLPVTLRVVALLKKDLATPVSGVPVRFRLKGEWIGPVTTRPNGIAEIEYNQVLPLGDYQVEAHLQPKPGQNYAPASANFQLTVEKIRTSLSLIAGGYNAELKQFELSGKSAKVIEGHKIMIKGHLRRSFDTEFIANKAIRIDLNGSKIAELATDEKGAYEITIPFLGLPGKQYSLTAHFEGDAHYAKSGDGPVSVEVTSPKKKAYPKGYCLTVSDGLKIAQMGVKTRAVTRVCAPSSKCEWDRSMGDYDPEYHLATGLKGYEAKDNDGIKGVRVTFKTESGNKTALSDSDGFAVIEFIPQSTSDIPVPMINDPAYEAYVWNGYPCITGWQVIGKGFAALKITGPGKARLGETIHLKSELFSLLSMMKQLPIKGSIMLNGKPLAVAGNSITLPVESSLGIGKKKLRFEYKGDPNYHDVYDDLTIDILPSDN